MPIISTFPTGSNTDETEQLIGEHNNSTDAHKELFKKTNDAATAAKTAADKAQNDLAEHAGKTDNPHGVTAAQVGADAKGSSAQALTDAKAYTNSAIQAAIQNTWEASY